MCNTHGVISLSYPFCYFLLQSYVVYFGAHSHGVEPSSLELDRASNSHYEFLGSFLGRYGVSYWVINEKPRVFYTEFNLITTYSSIIHSPNWNCQS